MSTRGFITFAVDGENKTTYNHSDSYPSWLGVHLLKWLREADHAEVRRQAQALRVVDGSTSPTTEDIAQHERWMWTQEQHGGHGDLRKGQEWYDLLHETRGDPDAILGCGVIEDASGFPGDSLFAEWGYVIDLDGDGLFEVYKGFQTSPISPMRRRSSRPPILTTKASPSVRDTRPLFGGGSGRDVTGGEDRTRSATRRARCSTQATSARRAVP